MRRNSLTVRLTLAASALIGLALAATGLLLVVMFRDHIERRFDKGLGDQLEELVAASETDSAGVLALTWTPVDPRFNRPGSGWYWQISLRGEVIRRSLSLTGMALPGSGGVSREIVSVPGPAGRPLRILRRSITLPGAAGALDFAVAGPVDDIDADVWRFSAITATTLAVLGLFLVLAVYVQVRFGLRPLIRLRQALSDIRTGRSERMPAAFPDEVEPVVEELNALLEQNKALLQRARTQAGNLAHALKHPLTIMTHETSRLEGEQAELMSEQLAAMRNAINRHLSRARVAGLSEAVGMRTPVAESVEGLRLSMERLHAGRGLRIETQLPAPLLFAGNAEDLEEMLGNLMDNACKWAKSRVVVQGSNRDGRLILAVEDDGPGIAANDRGTVLRRGRRLDESVAGAGLGLDIVRDIVELYRGTLQLEASRLGGLKAELDLPAPEPG